MEHESITEGYDVTTRVVLVVNSVGQTCLEDKTRCVRVSHDLLSVAQHTYIPGRLWEERVPLVQKVDTQRSCSVV